MKTNTPSIILASQSPRRKQLLAEAGIEFTAIPADVEELERSYYAPQTALLNAILKAEHIAPQHPASLIIGSDTVVEFKEHILGKPADLNQARQTLRTLSGHTHQVVTGVSLRRQCDNTQCDFAVTTEVTFKDIDDATIEEYISKVNTLDKAGAYGIQSHGELLVESVNGPIDNVIGLPCERLLEALKILIRE